MNFSETIDYLFSQLPMFQRIGGAAYKANLNNTLALCHLLNHPENKFKSIHVAGTNGKGSISHLLAAILQSAGYKTGLYTSPHLKDFRERIKINGKMIAKEAVVEFVEKYKKEFEVLQPSFFEMTVGMAFDYFAKEKVDIAILETGLGGRLDATNVVQPELSIISNISFDHQQFLGNTLEAIAKEKAGIIKPEIPVIISETQKEIKHVFVEKAKALNAPIAFADQEISDGKAKKYLCELKGSYQQKNIKCVLWAIETLKKQGFDIPENAIKEGIEKVIQLTGIMGRWQQLGSSPIIIADTAHNEAGIAMALSQIKNTPHHQLHLVFGVVNDKPIDKILSLLPSKASYYFCKANLPRALDQIELAKQAAKHGLSGIAFSSVQEAYKAAKENAAADDLIYVGGSTFVVAEVL